MNVQKEQKNILREGTNSQSRRRVSVRSSVRSSLRVSKTGTLPTKTPTSPTKLPTKQIPIKQIPTKTQKIPTKTVKKTKQDEAAIMIQKTVRGWLQHMKFRVLCLQILLNVQKNRTKKFQKGVKDELDKRKAAYKAKMKKQPVKDTKETKALMKVKDENKKIIDDLRKKNKKMREENLKLRQDIQDLAESSGRVADATENADAYVEYINSHAENFKETHKGLLEVIPKYKESVLNMKEKVEERTEFYMSENKVRVSYLNTIETILEQMSQRSNQKELVDEIVDLCVSLEKIEKKIEVKVPKDKK